MFRVLVFTDEPVVANGLRTVLAAKTGFKVVSVSDSPATLIETAEAVKPDLLLLDMTPEITFGVLVEFQKRIPGCRVVLWARTVSTELAYQAIEHGIRGILRKTLPAESVLRCLQMVADGGLWFEESLKARFLAAKAVTLSRREGQLVGLLSQGLKNKEIAASLLISEGTVKVYLSRLFRKLGVNDRFELALFGLKNMAGTDVPYDARPDADGQNLTKEAGQSDWLRSLVLHRPSDKVRNTIG
jgi:DNA-binding NarL/FixJ family response regulator